MENVEIARILGEVADLLEISGANPFRVRAYRNARRTVEAQSVRFAKLVAEGRDLTELPGIGKEMARHVAEMVATGRLGLHEEMVAELPAGLVTLMRLPGVGPKKARKLWDELGVSSVDDLEAAARAGKVRGVAGFGVTSEAKILAGIADQRRLGARFRLADADDYAAPLLEYLRAAPEAVRVEVAGSYRRRRETVGDLDLLAIAGGDPAALARRFLDYPQVADVLAAGDTRVSVRLGAGPHGRGLQVDLRVLPPESYGAALVYFTGSKEHNIRLRRRGVERGLKISEYGVFRVPEKDEEDEDEDAGELEDGGGDARHSDPREGDRIGGAEEEEVYAAVGLAWVPPELREDRGEVEAAAKGKLPRLIEAGDLRGDYHMHTTWSDGRNSVEEMVAACAASGYAWCAITDHSKALAMTAGLDERRLAEQWVEIDAVAARHPEIRVFKGMEVDVLADGSLDLSDEMLERLDLVIVSVHSRFNLSAAEQTERILRALSHPRVHVLGHPTGRKVGRRKGYEVDLDAVLARAAERGVAVEHNADPARLDLSDLHLVRAKELGCKVAIGSDAHRAGNLDLIRYGVEQARRAWLVPGDVINCWTLEELLAFLAKREPGGAGGPARRSRGGRVR